LKPVAVGKVKPRYVKRASRSLADTARDHADVALVDRAPYPDDVAPATCAVAPECLARVGETLGVERIVGVTLAERGGDFEMCFVLVHVATRSELVRATESIAHKALVDEPGEKLEAFLENVPDAPAGAMPSRDVPAGEEDSDDTAAEAGPEVASPSEQSGPAKPWAQGVSAEAQARALALYSEGNTLFETSKHARALAKYREAVGYWDHPAIRFNMTVCLINLERPVQAFENLQKALAYGEAPLGPKLFADGQTYQRLLLGRLARLKVTCKETGAEVTLDGEALFVGPGEATRLLLPGAHQIVARKPSYLARTENPVLLPGKQTAIELDMVPLEDATEMKRRWSRWKPWAVVGGGAVVALFGTPLYLLANSNYEQYDREIELLCAEGCAPSDVPGPTADVKSRADWERGAAVMLFAAGAAGVATGIVLALFNQPRPVPVEDAASVSVGNLRLVPFAGPESTGVAAAFSF